MKNYEVIVFETAKYRSPIVYIFHGENGPLYVGYSAAGIGRPFSKDHHQREAFERSTSVEVRVFKSALRLPFNGRGGIRSNGKTPEDSHLPNSSLTVNPSKAVFIQGVELNREFIARRR